jgi:hypothetical protein
MSMSPLWLVPVGSSLQTRGMVLGFFGNSTSNTKYIVIIVLWFMSLLYSLP